ncbi:MAG TPA: fused MFS/spermidine synthase, partial [Chloroflexota bacterium]
LDHLVHSFNSLEDPTYLHYGYLRVYEDVTAYVASSEPAFRALFLGGGGYTLPRALEVRYPQSRLEVIEIDPEVTAVAYQEMGLPTDTRVVTYNHDGRLMVDELLRAGQRYHLIFGDAFNDLSVPYHLTTREFAEKVRGLLVDDGFYLVNVIDHLQEGQFIRAFARTLGEVFPHVYIMYEGAPWESGGLSTYVVVASNRPIDQEALERGARRGGGDPVGTRIMPSERYRTWLAAVPAPVLTDEYAPVDNLIAPNFLRR